MTTSNRRNVQAAGSPLAGAGSGYPRPYGERYVLLKELGKGGMGQVFMAVTGGTNVERVCALKVIRRLDAAGRSPEEMGRRFLDEAKVVTKLSHENLVYVFDFGLVSEQPGASSESGRLGTGDSAYLAMEYLRGKTLTETWNRCAIKQTGIPPAVALFVVSELAAGLAYAHALSGFDLVHRDVSPSNVMITYTGGVKLIDFGLAKWKQKVAQTLSGVNWGKVSYMSPEQHLGRAIDHRSDIYSLGVILWELLAGRQLFPNEEARRATLEVPPPSRFNPTLSPELDAVVQKALAGDADVRFDSAVALVQALVPHLPREAGKLNLARFMDGLFSVDMASEQAQEEHLLALAARPGTPAAAAEAPRASPDPLVGATLAGRYFVKRKIGEGSMGAVYEGHHTGIGKRVAIKIPHRTERRREKLIARFRMEANAASQIGHPNIADVTDCGTTEAGDFFFVMEYVDGTDLSRVLRRSGAMALERCLLIAIQACRALEAAHRAGIIHRDLKPSNVMLVRDREDNELVKVLDFGVAKFLRSDGEAVTELTQADAAVGTPRYMAPEQIESGREIDFRVDIYAMGGLLYTMLSGGRSPFEADGVHELWRQKMHEAPVPLATHRSDLPEDLTQLVMRCLARAPDERPQSMDELRRALLACLEHARKAGSSVLAMRVPSSTAVVENASTAPVTHATGRIRRWAMIGGLVLLVGAGLTWALRALTPAPTPAGASGTPGPTLAPRPAPPDIEAPPPQSPQAEGLPPAQPLTTAPPTPAVSQPAQGSPAALPPPAQPLTTAPLTPAVSQPAQGSPAALPPPAQPLTTAPPTPAVSQPARPSPTARPTPASSIPAAPPSPAPAPEPAPREQPAAAPLAARPTGATASDAPSRTSDALLAEAEEAFRRNQLVQATVLAQKALAVTPTATGYLQLGKILLFRDDATGAIAAYQAALRLEPGNSKAQRGLAQARARAETGER